MKFSRTYLIKVEAGEAEETTVVYTLRKRTEYLNNLFHVDTTEVVYVCIWDFHTLAALNRYIEQAQAPV